MGSLGSRLSALCSLLSACLLSALCISALCSQSGPTPSVIPCGWIPWVPCISALATRMLSIGAHTLCDSVRMGSLGYLLSALCSSPSLPSLTECSQSGPAPSVIPCGWVPWVPCSLLSQRECSQSGPAPSVIPWMGSLRSLLSALANRMLSIGAHTLCDSVRMGSLGFPDLCISAFCSRKENKCSKSGNTL
jgi:hypothetical protein